MLKCRLGCFEDAMYGGFVRSIEPAVLVSASTGTTAGSYLGSYFPKSNFLNELKPALLQRKLERNPRFATLCSCKFVFLVLRAINARRTCNSQRYAS